METSRSSVFGGTALAVSVHAAMLILAAAFVMFGLPKVMRVYESAEVALPAATMLAVNIMQSVQHYWWLMMPLVVLFLALDGVIHFSLRKSARPGFAATWSLLVTAVQGAVIALLVALTCMPLRGIAG